MRGLLTILMGVDAICDQVCENQPCQCTEIATFFDCYVITHVLVMVTG